MEKYKKGGYTILDLESSTIYADSVKALDSNKPVVVYDGTNKPYFADTITLDGTSVVITKGGKTITINDVNAVSSEGDIQTHLYKVSVQFNYQVSEENNFIFLVNLLLTKKENITFEDIYNNIVNGDIFVNDGSDLLCYTNDVQNNVITIRYLDGTSWTSYDNDLTSDTISNIQVSQFKQIY